MLRAFAHQFVYEQTCSLLLGRHLEVELLGHTGTLCLITGGAAMLLSTAGTASHAQLCMRGPFLHSSARAH